MYNVGGLVKHIGRDNNTKARIAVVYKQLTEDPLNCLVVYIDSLPSIDRDEIMILINSEEGQREDDFSVAMFKRNNMLAHFHKSGFLNKIAIESVDMLPVPTHPVPLKDIVNMINVKKGIPTIDEIRGISNAGNVENLVVDNAQAEATEVQRSKRMTAEEKSSIAKGLVFQAKLLEDEMKKKLKEAYKLDPSLKPAKSKAN